MNPDRKVVIVTGVRTPFGRMGGGLRTYYPSELLGFAIRELVSRTGLSERAKVDGVFAGSALPDAHTNNVARFATLYAGLPVETQATFVEMQCGSGIASINQAALQILNEDIDIAIAGGAESYSQLPCKFSMSVEPYKLIAPHAVPQLLAPEKDDQLTMIEISDKMAEKWNVSRTECDEFALRSQERAAAYIASGRVAPFLFSISTPQKKADPIVCDHDEQPRASTMEGLAKLKTVREGGVTTAGNASGRNDGAAVVLMMSEEKALELGFEPMAWWRGGAVTGVEPKYMGIGPAFSNLKIMKRFGLSFDDVDVFECNEAFAAQNLSVIREMEDQTGRKIDMEKWNPNGGAIAFGHPNGASGGRIAMHAMDELQKTGGRYGIFSSCCGGGLGVSTLIERYGE
ncbi:MAG: thiolase family protein [Lachnospiraceae bacterium]|nr:thiolase family protein [Lachnospiraceae bacterium]MBR6976957.1 thiolase family protein [Lachnospiraceae bacterium]